MCQKKVYLESFICFRPRGMYECIKNSAFQNIAIDENQSNLAVASLLSVRLWVLSILTFIFYIQLFIYISSSDKSSNNISAPKNNSLRKQTRIKLRGEAWARLICVEKSKLESIFISLWISTEKHKASRLKLSTLLLILDVDPGFFKMKSLLCLYLDDNKVCW